MENLLGLEFSTDNFLIVEMNELAIIVTSNRRTLYKQHNKRIGRIFMYQIIYNLESH